jgi:hypothetical protein
MKDGASVQKTEGLKETQTGEREKDPEAESCLSLLPNQGLNQHTLQDTSQQRTV